MLSLTLKFIKKKFKSLQSLPTNNNECQYFDTWSSWYLLLIFQLAIWMLVINISVYFGNLQLEGLAGEELELLAFYDIVWIPLEAAGDRMLCRYYFCMCSYCKQDPSIGSRKDLVLIPILACLLVAYKFAKASSAVSMNFCLEKKICFCKTQPKTVSGKAGTLAQVNAFEGLKTSSAPSRSMREPGSSVHVCQTFAQIKIWRFTWCRISWGWSKSSF